jgi:hypothetical protein
MTQQLNILLIEDNTTEAVLMISTQPIRPE